MPVRDNYLIVGNMDVFHGEKREFVRPLWISPMFHVSSYREQLRGRHDTLGGGVDDDLVGRLKRDAVVFAERQRV